MRCFALFDLRRANGRLRNSRRTGCTISNDMKLLQAHYVLFIWVVDCHSLLVPETLNHFIVPHLILRRIRLIILTPLHMLHQFFEHAILNDLLCDRLRSSDPRSLFCLRMRSSHMVRRCRYDLILIEVLRCLKQPVEVLLRRGVADFLNHFAALRQALGIVQSLFAQVEHTNFVLFYFNNN